MSLSHNVRYDVQQLLLLPRRELQVMAKSLGIKANLRSADLAQALVAAAQASSQDASAAMLAGASLQECGLGAAARDATQAVGDEGAQARLIEQRGGVLAAAATTTPDDAEQESALSASSASSEEFHTPQENSSFQAFNVMDLFPKAKAASLHGAPRRIPLSPHQHAGRKLDGSPPIAGMKRLAVTPRTPKTPAAASRARPDVDSPKSTLKEAMRAERERRRRASTTSVWEKVESHSKPGRFYYFNPSTMETRWTLPVTQV